MTSLKKKITLLICLALSLVMLFVLSSCDNTETPSSDSTNTGETNTDSSTDTSTDSSTDTSTDSTTDTDSTTPIIPHVHTYGEFVITKEPSCTEKGSKEKKCSCGDTVTEAIEATGHTEEVIDGKAPTCTETGLTDGKKCFDCGKILVAQEIVSAKGHKISYGSCSVCKAEIKSEGLDYKLSEDKTYYIVTGMGTCTDTDLYIRGTHEGKPVKEIANGAFENCKRIRIVIIGDGIEVIGANAFYGCERLTEAVIGNDVKDLKGFEYCEGLARMTIGSGVAFVSGRFSESYKLVELYNLSSINIKNTSAGQHALNIYTPTEGEKKTFDTDDGYIFYVDGEVRYLVAYKGLETKLVLPEGCDGESYEVYKYAFNDQDEITSVVIPNAVTSLQNRAFGYCNFLSKVTIGEGVTSVGETAFESCTQLVEVYNLSSLDITVGSSDNGYVGYYAKVIHTSLNESSILKTTDDGYVFAVVSDSEIYLIGYVGNETELTLPESYNGKNYEIYLRAFYENDKITSVTIPNSVTSIGESAFLRCSKLTNVNYLGTIEEWCNISFDDYSSNPLNNRANLYLNEILVTNLVIPSTVTEIKDYAFYNCSSLASVTIPDSVTSIGNRAFSGCLELVEVYNLSSLDITAGSYDNGYVGYYAEVIHTSLDEASILETVDDYIFMTLGGKYYLKSYVGNETELTLPESYNGKNYEIYPEAFYGNDRITSVTIGDSVTSIGSNAFFGCTSLTSITIPDNVKTIGSNAFYGCPIKEATIHTNAISYIPKTNLQTVVINGGTSIGDDAFENCTSLTSIIIGNSVTSIGNCAFQNCTSLTSITIPDNVTFIKSFAFSDCTSLTSITIPDNVTSIGYYTFSGCISLENVTIGNGVTSIGDYAFSDCTSLTSITIGDSVKTIASDAFSGCTSLTSITVDAGNAYYKSIDGNLYSKDGEILIQYALGKKDTSFEIPNSVTSIGNYAFSGCASLTNVTIPDSVTFIGSFAFECCTSLTSITIGDSVKTIASDAFSGCTSLTSIIVDAGNANYKSIDGNLYSKDEKILIQYALGKKDTSFEIPSSVTSIGDYAFSGCASLTSVTIGKGVTSIGSNAFSGCISLTSVNYLGRIEEWCNISFGSSSANPLSNGAGLYVNGALVTEVIVTQSFEKIGDYAFYNCELIKKIVLSKENDIPIGTSAFYGCGAEPVYDDGSMQIIVKYMRSRSYSFSELKVWSGTVLTLPTKPYSSINSGETFFGWYSHDGVLYEKGETITVSEDMIFYPAIGKEISTASELYSFLQSGGDRYARLTSDITVSGQRLSSNWSNLGVGIIDLNGHTLTSTNVQYGFGEQRTGMIFVGQGTVNFTSNSTSGAFFMTSYHGYGDGNQLLWVGKDVTVNSNVVLAKITNFMYKDGLPQIKIYGTVNAPALVEYVGAYSMEISIYESAKINVSAGATKPLVYDSSFSNSSAVITIYGGEFKLPEDFKGIISEDETKIEVVIKGGSFNCSHINKEILPYVEPTCVKIGLTEGEKCTDCGNILVKQTVIPAKGHTEQIIKGYEATCTEAGLTDGKKCTTCGEIFVKQAVILAKGHTEQIIKGYEATCTQAGLTDGKKCTVCKETLAEQETIPANDNHTSIQIIQGYEATCIQTGLTDGKICNACKETLAEQETIPTNDNHVNVQIVPGYEATCTEAGLSDGKKCLDCRETIAKPTVIPAKGHTEQKLSAVEATCTKIGLTEGKKCSVCEQILVEQKTIPTNDNHTNVQIVQGYEPTCTKTGLTDGEKCFACGEIIIAQKTISAKGHTEQKIPAVEATCTKTGLTEGKKCSVCEQILVEQKTVPTNDNHTNVQIVQGYEPTCTKTGLTEGTKCFACDKTIIAQKVIPANGHTEQKLPAVEATCTKTGLTEGKKCSVCEQILVEQKTIFTNDNHTEQVIGRVEPTCTNTGLTQGTKCSECGRILVVQNELDALGHIYENSYQCSRCDYAFATPSEGLKYSSSQDGSYYIVTDLGSCNDTMVVIPYTYEGLPVKAIDEWAFYGYSSLESIIIPSSIESIGDFAFYGCSSLTIYCVAESQPSGWSSSWNSSNRPVYWYSESEPTTEGNYWYYGDNNKIVIW